MSIVSFVKDTSLAKKLEGVKEFARSNLLRFWQVHAPHFVDHGETHCTNIELLLYRIIPPDVKGKMSEYEIFLLLCGVWLHDVGMLAKGKDENEKQVRETHHQKSRELIRKSLPEIDLTDDERYVVGEIAYFHRKSADLSYAKEVYEMQQGSTISKVRVRFLCALVRLADGCEIAHSRSSRKMLQIANVDEEAKFHHEAHLHVSAVDFDIVTREILIAIRVKNTEDALLLGNFLKGNLEKELFTVKDILKECGVDYNTVKPQITIDSFAEEMPHVISKPTLMSLEEKLVEMEKRTGYYPNMTVDTDLRIYIFYETIAQTAKELQSEVISVLDVVCDLFFDKQKIILTLNRIRDLSGTVGKIDPEIVTVVVETKDFDEYKKNQISKSEFWSRLTFFRRAMNDKVFNMKKPLIWKLIL